MERCEKKKGTRGGKNSHGGPSLAVIGKMFILPHWQNLLPVSGSGRRWHRETGRAGEEEEEEREEDPARWVRARCWVGCGSSTARGGAVPGVFLFGHQCSRLTKAGAAGGPWPG